jgi:hypothetical protein
MKTANHAEESRGSRRATSVSASAMNQYKVTPMMLKMQLITSAKLRLRTKPPIDKV